MTIILMTKATAETPIRARHSIITKWNYFPFS